ncbi:rho GTPase-activating protein 11B-like [Denticeps clupeoides]|uniref:rho GTPase-activating protein 11B-like n=1 Tax=Denticeps clupeoides TaxID=299321 RepID=UPI0010A511A4|nr:rho GTPase-activating protein 11B-like [Denticeps clupeoides]XP_028847760.1 rho GTPase-activating protein 11B-like [Denticeps clupeoides]
MNGENTRRTVLKQLRSEFGIKLQNRNKKRSSEMSAARSVKLFGTALDALQHCVVQDYGSVPCFLLDACTSLLEHVQTEGIFRKSGSVARIKALQAKLDQGEDCLSSALPLDVAGLLKQFFRELPEPILPVGFHRALLKAQKLATWAERTKATMLLSCVLPEQNLSALQYFFSFLQSVSKRSAENRMDSSNLSVVFAPNLLHSAEGTKKMNGSTERKLKLQAAVVQCFIENAQYFGVVPSILGSEAGGLLSPPANAVDESCSHSGLRRSHGRRFREVINGALNKFMNRTPRNTPQSETAATPVEPGKTGSFSPKVSKKKAVRKCLRLCFSLGRSSKDPAKGSETAQDSTTEPSLSPAVLHITNAPQGTKFFSRPEVLP